MPLPLYSSTTCYSRLPSTIASSNSISVTLRRPSQTRRTLPRHFTILHRLREQPKETPRSHPSITPKPSQQKSPLKVWPFVLIFVTGSFLFSQIVKQRAGTYDPKRHSPSRP